MSSYVLGVIVGGAYVAAKWSQNPNENPWAVFVLVIVLALAGVGILSVFSRFFERR